MTNIFKGPKHFHYILPLLFFHADIIAIELHYLFFESKLLGFTLYRVELHRSTLSTS